MEGPPEMRSLKDKWKDHWETRNQIFDLKPQNAEKIGMAFFWCFSSSLFYTAMFVLIPQIGRLETNLAFKLHLVALFITFEAVLNWLLCARNGVSQVTRERVPQGEQTSSIMEANKYEWKHCSNCQLEVPPRAHHCKVCKVCILKRDHHCFFTGSCVGFSNERYFISLLFYLVAGSLYFMYLVLLHLDDPYPMWSRRGLNYFPLVAVWNWFTGDMFTYHFLLLVQFYVTVFMGSICLCYFVWELMMVYRGQTSYEATRGVHVFRVDPSTHFRTVFGPFWMLNFIFPMPISQEGDGIHWQFHKNLKGH